MKQKSQRICRVCKFKTQSEWTTNCIWCQHVDLMKSTCHLDKSIKKLRRLYILLKIMVSKQDMHHSSAELIIKLIQNLSNHQLWSLMQSTCRQSILATKKRVVTSHPMSSGTSCDRSGSDSLHRLTMRFKMANKLAKNSNRYRNNQPSQNRSAFWSSMTSRSTL